MVSKKRLLTYSHFPDGCMMIAAAAVIKKIKLADLVLNLGIRTKLSPEGS